MLNGSATPARARRRASPRGRSAARPPAPAEGFDAETLAVARALLQGIADALDPPGDAAAPSPVQLKDLATAVRTAQAVGRLALGADDAGPGGAAQAIAALLNEIDGGTRGLRDGG